jgi:hypothetical protein
MSGWAAVRCVFCFDYPDGQIYEERITLWQTDDMDTAIALAEAEAEEYAEPSHIEYAGLAQVYLLGDEPSNGAEVFSLMRDSELEPSDYLDAYFDTGGEHQRTAADSDGSAERSVERAVELLGCVTVSSEEEAALILRLNRERLKVDEAMLVAMNNAFDVTQLALDAADTAAFRTALCDRFGFDEIEANAVIDTQFWALTRARRENQSRRIAERRADVEAQG